MTSKPTEQPGPSASARAFCADPNVRYKLIYLARRNPTLAPDAFPAAWRAHSRLAKTFSSSLGRHFVSSNQCVKDRLADDNSSFVNEYDGSTILAMKSWEDLLAARYHPHSLDELRKDEARVFASAVDDWTMAVEEAVWVGGETTEHVILSFLTPREGVPAEAFATTVRARSKTLVNTLRGASRIVCNRVVEPARAYRFAMVLEVWFANRNAALAVVADPESVATLEQPGVADRDQGVRLFAQLNSGRP